MTRPEHTDAYSCPVGASCPRARLLADLEILSGYFARLMAEWDARHVVHVGYLAEDAATLAGQIGAAHGTGAECGGGHG